MSEIIDPPAVAKIDSRIIVIVPKDGKSYRYYDK